VEMVQRVKSVALACLLRSLIMHVTLKLIITIVYAAVY